MVVGEDFRLVGEVRVGELFFVLGDLGFETILDSGFIDNVDTFDVRGLNLILFDSLSSTFKFVSMIFFSELASRLALNKIIKFN